MYFAIVIWVMCFEGIAFGVTVTFEPNKAALSDSVTITCKRSTGSSASITWELDSSPLTSCDGASNDVCIPSPTGYTFSTDVSVNQFNLTLASTSITDCKTYTCTDASTTTDTVSEKMHLSYWHKTEVTNTEPGANTGGSISITTGCVLSPDDLTITWTKIVNGNSVALSSPVTSTDRSTCTWTCHTEEYKKVTSGFTHTEYTGTDSETVQYKVTVSHSSYPDNADTLTWTSANYKLKQEMYDCPGLGNSTAVDSKAKCAGCWFAICCAILLVHFLIGIVLGCILICATCCCDCFKKGESCKDCVDNYYCKCKCFDSTPCGACCNIKGLPYWYRILWASVIGIPVALGVLVVWKCRKKCESQKKGGTRKKNGNEKKNYQTSSSRTGAKKQQVSPSPQPEGRNSNSSQLQSKHETVTETESNGQDGSVNCTYDHQVDSLPTKTGSSRGDRKKTKKKKKKSVTDI